GGGADVEQQLDRVPVGGPAGAAGGGEAGPFGAVLLADARGLLLADADDDLAGGAVHRDVRAVHERGGLGAGHHGGQAAAAGQDRGVAGRPAPLGHQRQHVRAETGGVGGGEVLGDQHERMARRRHARHGHAERGGDRAVLEVVQVGGSFGEVAA